MFKILIYLLEKIALIHHFILDYMSQINKINLFIFLLIMFFGQHKAQSEPSYLRKKRIFLQEIRKKDRQSIKNKLRLAVIASLPPTQLSQLLQNLPSKSYELLLEISKKKWQKYEKFIANFIIDKIGNNLNKFMDDAQLEPIQQIAMIMFLIALGDKQQQLYKDNYQQAWLRVKDLPFTDKNNFIGIFNSMLQKNHFYVLNDAHKAISSMTCNRFYQKQLNLYNNILKKQPTQQNIDLFLPKIKLLRLSEAIPFHFYSLEQKISMIEILIRILYLSSEDGLSNCFNLPKIIQQVQYVLFKCQDSDSLQAERILLLIYNINIDISSLQFVKRNGLRTLAKGMKDLQKQFKLRNLMAETYLNSIYNYPKEELFIFVQIILDEFLKQIHYIIEQFGENRQIEQMSQQVLKLIFDSVNSLESRQGKSKIQQIMALNKSIVESLQNHSAFQDIGFYQFSQGSSV